MFKLSLNELASEGERLCKLGDSQNGIKYFEEALKLYEQQTNEDESNKEKLDQKEEKNLLHVMSVIYNQMGNAYFNMQEYSIALEHHKKDLEMCEMLEDESGKAKACGNVGNTLQMMGEHDEAILYLLRNLEISKKLNDLTGEARALYNLANIYQAKGKFMGRLTYHDNTRDPVQGEFNDEIREVLNKSVSFYRETLKLVSQKDRAAEGRTYGNLGNTYYFLGDFESAIECHNQRLKIAKEYGDKPAERRAYSNLGNAYIFQGKFNEATEYYSKAMNVARSLGDKAIEAQSYYSLGNAYILLQDYSVAIDFHLRHLQIAQLLEDKIGESRAYWSLGNAYAAIGDLDNAIMYANKHLYIAQSIGDTTSELTAKKNLYDFQNILSSSGYRDSESGLFKLYKILAPVCSKYGNKYLKTNTIHKSVSIDSFYTNTAHKDNILDTAKQLKISHSKLLHCELTNTQRKNLNDSLLKCQESSSINEEDLTEKTNRSKYNNENELSFFETLSKVQSNRLEDQRCSLNVLNNKTNNFNTNSNKNNKNEKNSSKSSLKSTSKEIFNFILKPSHLKNIHNQNYSSSATDISNISKIKPITSVSNVISTSSFPQFSVSDIKNPSTIHSSTNSITSTPTTSSKLNKIKNGKNQISINNKKQAITVPADDAFFNMVQKIQSRRLNEQRTYVKSSLFKKPY